MHKNTRIGLYIAVAAGAFLGAALPARAVTIDVDLSGTFQTDSDILTVEFLLDSDRLVTFFTSSWGSANSGLGFDPALFLWDSNGDWLGIPAGYSEDAGLGGSAISNGVSHSYGENDVFLNTFLAAGSYTATLVQTGNYPANFPGPSNLADGFWYDNEPNYTRDIFAWGPNPSFNGAAGNDPRTGDWMLHLVGVSDYRVAGAPIPEPASLTLMALGAGVCALRYRRRSSPMN